MKNSKQSCIYLPGRGDGAVSAMIFMKISNGDCTRFDSVKNIIQNDSVSPRAQLAFKQMEGRALHKVTLSGPPITVWFCDRLAAASVLGV